MLSVHAEQSDELRMYPSLIGGDLRNTQAIRLTTSEPVAISHIRIWKTGQNEPALVSERTGSGNTSELTLDWNTLSGDDGTYAVEYSVKSVTNKDYVETYPITVVNNRPLVAIGDVQNGRELSGIVSRADITFRILIDGQELLNITPEITSGESTNGDSRWTFNIPNEIQDGTRDVTIYATSTMTGLVSLPGEKRISIATLVVSTPISNTDPIPITPTFPSLDLAPEIGQFVAPVIRPVSDTVQTKLYGVPVDDLTQSSATQPVLKPSNSSHVSVLGARDVYRVDRDSIAVSATKTGWNLVGIGWHWWLIIGIMTASLFVFGLRIVKLRKRQALVL